MLIINSLDGAEGDQPQSDPDVEIMAPGLISAPGGMLTDGLGPLTLYHAVVRGPGVGPGSCILSSFLNHLHRVVIVKINPCVFVKFLLLLPSR